MTREQAVAVVRTHTTVVWRRLGLLGVAPRDLDEACREVFLSVLSKLPESGEDSVAELLRQACLSIADRRRMEDGEDRTGDDLDELRMALGSLDDEERPLFVLHGIEEQSIEEVATSLGWTPSEAAQCFHRAVLKVSASLQNRRS